MKIIDFSYEHIEQAAMIAKQAYDAERAHVGALPEIETVPDLTQFAENGFGVAAIDDGTGGIGEISGRGGIIEGGGVGDSSGISGGGEIGGRGGIIESGGIGDSGGKGGSGGGEAGKNSGGSGAGSGGVVSGKSSCGRLLGFLCAYEPYDNAFSIPGLRGIFSPMGANGVIYGYGEKNAEVSRNANGGKNAADIEFGYDMVNMGGAVNRAKIFARLYQAAGAKWARAGATSHGVCLYAHDTEALGQFFKYGFGMRCVDAICGIGDASGALKTSDVMNDIGDAVETRKIDDVMSSIDDATESRKIGGVMSGIDDATESRKTDSAILESDGGAGEYKYYELAPADVLKVLPLENALDAGYIESPFFMYRAPTDEFEFIKNYKRYKSIYFMAEYHGTPIAFIKAELDGETFIQNAPGYLHCKGLYCMPEHRGGGVSAKLLGMLVNKLKTQGYTTFGVDFESINPSGSGFWLKHFDAYTYSVVRRIDS